MARFSGLVNSRRPQLHDIFGFMDGVHLPIFNPSDPTVQNAYYNGWDGGVSVTNVIVFTPDGCICIVRSNCPGSWHDSITALPIYHVLNNPLHTPAPYRIIADSAFTATDRCVTCLTLTQRRNASRAILGMNASITSVRQAVEWGMNTLQSIFNRLTVAMPCDVQYNRRLLLMVFHLFNFRARTHGNQIKTVFDPDDNDIDIEAMADAHDVMLTAMFGWSG
jgi:hypothetical protein